MSDIEANNNEQTMRKKRKPMSLPSKIIMVLCIIVFVVAAGALLFILNEYRVANDNWLQVSAETQSDVEKANALNSDCAAWIKIDDTRIDYPVMLTPKDPEYYLHRDFKKNESIAGTPFIGVGCTLDGDNILVHGHDMRDGSMFAGLLDYENSDFLKKHSTIHFDTLEGDADYKIISMFRIDVSHSDHWQYYNYVGDMGKKKYDEYVKEVLKRSVHDCGVTPEYGDQLITLSTCSYGTSEERFIVVAVKK